MGDRAYARFSIPVSALTPARRRRLAIILGESMATLDAVLARQPDPDSAGYANELALRMVYAQASVVSEYDQSNYGGADQEQGLITAGIPFLRVNGPGVSFGPTVTIYAGSGAAVTLSGSDETTNEVMVPVSISAGKAVLNPSWMTAARRFARIRMKLFGSAPSRIMAQPR